MHTTKRATRLFLGLLLLLAVGCGGGGTTIADAGPTYTVGGTVTGLVGSGLVLQNDGRDDLTVNADGSFTFAISMAAGVPYSVTVSRQPTGPTQTCAVTKGSGTLGADVTNVAVTCASAAFAVGGTVTGLAGPGLVLRNNGGDDLALVGDGTFAFATPVASGEAYEVTVAQQPNAPAQKCTVASGSGTVSDGPVTSVEVTCATDSFTVGGTVTGLAGTGLKLKNNGGDELAVSANGAFTFATALESGAAFAVTVSAQPTGPAQTCAVSGGTGTVGSADVTSVTVNCAANVYTVGGTVTGLVGTGLVLQNNAGDDLAISGSGTFAFATTLAAGSSYAVTVHTQPSSPTQTCVVTGGSGSIVASNVTSVAVDCTTETYTIGGTLTGLAGTGLVLQNNLGNNLSIAANGTFTFTTALRSGATYAVTVLTQPAGPAQTCTVTQASGLVASANVTNVAVTCSTRVFHVGGTVLGLLGSGLVLQNNAGDDLAISADGTFTFATTVASGAVYAVTVETQPSTPTQTCTVLGGAGTMVAADVTSVVVNCATAAYAIGGTVSGLAGTGLELLLNGTAALTVTANGAFAFPTALPSGDAYAVTVAAPPASPWQTCVVSNDTGTVVAGDVTSVEVACTTNEYTVGGTVTGLLGTGLVLRNNGGDDLSVAADGAFAFATALASGTAYTVTVETSPSSPTQACVVMSDSGVVGGGPVTSVVVNCQSSKFTVGGTVSGLGGTGLVLQNDGGNDLAISANGSFTFTTPLTSGMWYAVAVKTQPSSPWQTCTVANGSGTMGGAAVTNVTVTCATNSYTIGGTLALPNGTVVLRNNGGNDLTLTATSNFTFTTPIASGGAYAVTVASAPAGLACVVSNGTGTVTGANITNVIVSCQSANATVRDVAGTWSPSTLVPCGNGTNTNCTQAVAETSCTSIGKRLVSHASNGTAAVISLGATNSCYWSISYFTNTSSTLAGQCLIGVSNETWSNCCGTTNWHGNIVTIPTTLSQQYGYTSVNDSGYSASMSNVSGTTWGCIPTTTAPPARAGCTTYYVACE
jgi:large repetitive protein